MANKALSKRQKLTIRVEPSQRAGKPRNPLVVPARQRVAGPHRKGASGRRQLQVRLLKKLVREDGDKED